MTGSQFITDGPFEGLRRKHYRMILIDPPWKYLTYSEKGQGRSPDQHYGTMSIDDLKLLPIKDLAHKDAIVIFWVIDTHIEIALDIIKSLGFVFKTVGFYFRKENRDGSDFMGMGYWTRANPEQAWVLQDPACERQWNMSLVDGDYGQALLATAGRPARKARNVRRLISGKIREHSRKPDEIHARCEALGDGPYLELFGRRQIPGWTVWGNENTKFGGFPAAVLDVIGYDSSDVL